jgi:hypothetical protein
MGMGTKIVTHASIGIGMSIFSNCRYGDEDYSTISIPPLPSLLLLFSMRLELLLFSFFNIVPDRF